MRRTYSVLGISTALALLCGCSTQEKVSPLVAVKAAHEGYLKANASGYDWFANASDGYGGVPLILMRALPDLAPEIWGKPEEQFSRFGFMPNPDKPDGPLPLGLSWDSMDPSHPAQQLHPVALTCGACHIGRVRLENGTYMTLVGGPNTQFDVRMWRKAFELTVHKLMSTPKDINATAARLREVISAKPANYFYRNYRGITDQVEAGERQAFLSTGGGKDVAVTILTAFAGKIFLGEVATNKQKATSYSKPNAPPLDGGSPGQSDGSGDLIPRLLLLDTVMSIGPDKTLHGFMGMTFPALPIQLATVTDILSTWQQGTQNLAQIDGSVKSPFFRNVAASLAVAGDPKTVNVQNADITAKFISKLPPPAYPFALDVKKAEHGKELFKANCSPCHKSFNETVYGVEAIGTDANRSKVLNSDAFALFTAQFVASVPPDYEITDSNGVKSKPHDLPVSSILISRTTPATQGYVANGLEGAWARAPYLHNGSVPTLYHLLVPAERPAKFARGAVGYDPAKVGFQWELANVDAYRSKDPTTAVFDTSWDSSSKAGHDANLTVDANGVILRSGWDGREKAGEVRVRLDWSGDSNRDALADLLEYLKTI
ncbi:MAG: hypothetical protein JWO80_5268 [Bryobacterales bacterium]|nr:hypothetical protein [Bryobacterales bacterium]